jgi:uncharacterized membrane protein YfcA
MRFFEWFRPGIRVKRWLILGIVGLVCISFGLSYMVNNYYWDTLKTVLSIFLIISGLVFIFISIRYVIKTFFVAISNSGFKMSLDSERLSNLLYEKRILIKGPKIVAIGGGTGLSTM